MDQPMRVRIAVAREAADFLYRTGVGDGAAAVDDTLDEEQRLRNAIRVALDRLESGELEDDEAAGGALRALRGISSQETQAGEVDVREQLLAVETEIRQLERHAVRLRSALDEKGRDR